MQDLLTSGPSGNGLHPPIYIALAMVPRHDVFAFHGSCIQWDVLSGFSLWYPEHPYSRAKYLVVLRASAFMGSEPRKMVQGFKSLPDFTRRSRCHFLF
jgi:hypothetical protein